MSPRALRAAPARRISTRSVRFLPPPARSGEVRVPVPNTLRGGPDERGHFGIYGGRFVAETVMPLVLAVEAAYAAPRGDPGFRAGLDYYREHYVGGRAPYISPS